MLRQEAWADLRDERWSLFTFVFCPRYPSAEMHQLLLPGWTSVSSLSLSLPKAAGPGSVEPLEH